MRVTPGWIKEYKQRRHKSTAERKPPKKELTEEPVYRSKWEVNYAHMLELRKRLPDDHPEKIIDWKHEPLKLKLYTKVTTKKGVTARRCIYYVPDFMILHVDGSMELVEVKGYERKAGELKYFQAVEKYPGFTWRKVGKEKGIWVDIHLKRRSHDRTN